jgi:DNA-binding CsgD family transcriptional regulator
MTLLFILLDCQTFLVHKSELEPEQLATKIHSGDWSFVGREDAWFSRLPRRSIILGGMVVVIEGPPVQPGPENAVRLLEIEFTRRQLQILECLMEGLTARQIAVRLKISKRTTDEHLAAIRQKLEARTNTQSLGRAVALGYWKPKI